MNGLLTIALSLAQVATQPGPGKPEARSLAAPYSGILPSFGLTTESEKKTREEMTVRAFTYRENFLDSMSAKKDKETCGLYFTRAEYAKMRGNVIFGYWWASPGFVWKPEWNSVAFTAPGGVHESSKPIQPQAWDKAMQFIATREGLVLSDNAPIKIRGAVVAATLDPQKWHTRGFATICEWRVQSPGGVLLYRFGIMKPTLGAAIGSNLDWIVNFARGINGKPKTGESGNGPAKP